MPTAAESELWKIWKTLARHEKRLRQMNFTKNIRKFFKFKLSHHAQKDAFRGVHIALCIDTRDPLKQNRVKFFSPVIHVPITGGVVEDENTMVIGNATTKISQLDWAWPISAMGGFDDCGLTWVPPAGSTIALLFEHGSPDNVYYIGSTWHRDRGPMFDPFTGAPARNWDYDIPEFEKLWAGHRGGYMVGRNDESQVLPPWNTDNYQGFDIDALGDVDLIPDAATKTTWPHIYGFTTPEKHRLKMDDGDPKCNRRWKRLEILSSMGNFLLMKDDPFHHCGDWNNPQCAVSYVDVVPETCTVASTISVISVTIDGDPINVSSFIFLPYPCEQGPENCPTAEEQPSTTAVQEYLGTEHLCPGIGPFESSTVMPVDCIGVLRGLTDFCFSFNNTGNNKYHKHRQECFPYYCNSCGLPQSGMQLQSRSGHTLVMDDSVEEPRERPEWERAQKVFDMDGCTGNFKGRTYWRSATGHYIEMSDIEDQPKVRSIRNGINVVTALGNQICLNDHSKPTGISDADEGVQPPNKESPLYNRLATCIAGELRGIHIKSTAEHTLDFVDDTNEQCNIERQGCGKPGAYAKKAFIRMRSGYGLSFIMADFHNQKKTDQQYIQIMAPQTDNLVRGPHVFHMQEKATGPGQVFLRAGGDFIAYTWDDFVEVVGEEKDNPSNKLEFVSKNKIVKINEIYFNRAKTHVLQADDYVFLLAGKDCVGDDGSGQPCVYPVVVAATPIPEYITAISGLKASEHVFASAGSLPADPCEGIASD